MSEYLAEYGCVGLFFVLCLAVLVIGVLLVCWPITLTCIAYHFLSGSKEKKDVVSKEG